MGILSNLFRKPEPPEPYDWAFLRESCLRAIGSSAMPAELAESELGGLDYDRLTASGEAAEEVVVEIWAVLKNAKTPELSASQAQEYLFHAAEVLRSLAGPQAAAAGLKAIEASVRKV